MSLSCDHTQVNHSTLQFSFPSSKSDAMWCGTKSVDEWQSNSSAVCGGEYDSDSANRL